MQWYYRTPANDSYRNDNSYENSSRFRVDAGNIQWLGSIIKKAARNIYAFDINSGSWAKWVKNCGSAKEENYEILSLIINLLTNDLLEY